MLPSVESRTRGPPGLGRELPLQLVDAVQQLQDQLHAGEVDPSVACQLQDRVQSFEIVIGVAPDIARGARRPKEPGPLVEAEGLGVDTERPGHVADAT